VKDFTTNEYKNLSKYVTYTARIYEGDGVKAEPIHEVKTRICNDSDWDKFYSPATRDKSKFDKLRVANVLHCMEDYDEKGKKINKRLFGPNYGMTHRSLALNFMACKADAPGGPVTDCINKASDTDVEKD